MDFVLSPPLPRAVPVADSTAYFAIARVFCIGRNYRWTPDEAAPRDMPGWFMKPASAVELAGEPLPYPPGTAAFCPEVELVVAIGHGGRDIATHAAFDHVWGYAAGLDMTRRDLQQHARRTGAPWEPSKAFDHSAPVTPIMPVSRCGHPREGAIHLSVNGVERQRADLAGLLWPVPDLVAMLSRSVALQPGDLIFTGTPAGVAPVQRGDVIHAGVAGVGELTLTVGG
ncbi:Fumarylacetoacetase-like C-terminal domain-containing protein [Cupriavidus sp. H19C3]